MFVNEALSPPTLPSYLSFLDQVKYHPPLAKLPSPPDPAPGLYIQSRLGVTVHVKVLKECIAFQTGEALERITKGRFKAVPHFVKGVRPRFQSEEKVARNTLAVFTQPNMEEVVNKEKGITFAKFAKGVVEKHNTYCAHHKAKKDFHLIYVEIHMLLRSCVDTQSKTMWSSKVGGNIMKK